MCLWKDPAPDPRFEENGPRSVSDLFEAGTEVILIAGKYKGCKGVVTSVLEKGGEQKEHLINTKVEVVPPEPPFGLAIVRSVNEGFMSGMEASKILKMPVSVFGKLTGTFSVDPGRYELGLNLKQQGSHAVPAYTRQKKQGGKKNSKSAWENKDNLLVTGSAGNLLGNTNGDRNRGGDDRVEWEYSASCVKLVALYLTNFPKLVNHLKKNPSERFYQVRAFVAECTERYRALVHVA